MELIVIISIWLALAGIAFLLMYSIGKINKEYEQNFYNSLANELKDKKEDIKLIYCGVDSYEKGLYSGSIYDTRLWTTENKIFIEVKSIRKVFEYNNVQEFRNNWCYF